MPEMPQAASGDLKYNCMVTKRRALFVSIFLVAGGLVFLYRYSLLNALQRQVLKGIASQAVVANRDLLRDTAYRHHRLYQLKGIERLWPHRVNSLQRLRYLYDGFAGFECDIWLTANTGDLVTGHDEPDGDLFVDYLRTDSAREKAFWLDLKNVGKGNIAPFCLRLESLNQEFVIKDRVFLECYDTLVARRLTALGYLSGLNVLAAGIRMIPTDSIGLLTTEAAMQHSVDREFPGRKLLSWDLSFRDGFSRNTLLRRANDTNLLVCLINVKSPGYR